MRKQKRLNRQRQVRKFRVTNAVKRHTDRMRLSVFRSAKHIYAQIIDDQVHKTVAAASSVEKAFKASGKSGGNCEGAAVIGQMIAERAKAANVTEAALDRSGHKYHGRVKALADAARDAGLDLGAKSAAEEAAPAKGAKSSAAKGGAKAKK